MSGLHQRAPGLAGLIGQREDGVPPPPFFSLLADGVHVAPAVATLLFRAAPHRALLISDAIELAGLPDGVYPGHAQIPCAQRKEGPVATIEGTDTLIGACGTVADAVRNLVAWSGCGVAAAARTVTENVAALMCTAERGGLAEGQRADFVVLEEDGSVRETWVSGRKVWSRVDGWVNWSPHDAV